MKRRAPAPTPLFEGPPAGPEAAAPAAAADPPNALNALSGEQRAAAELFANRVISASAGTGKTRTLTGIYVGLLSGEVGAGEAPATPSPAGLWPSQIVAVTYTVKAAAELQEQLGQALAARRAAEPPAVSMAEPPGPRAEHLRRCWEELPGAPVSTIHSFCQRLLRESGARASVPAGFSIMEEEESDELLGQSLGEEAAEILASGRDPVLAALAREWGVLTPRSGLVAVGRALIEKLALRGVDAGTLAGDADEARDAAALREGWRALVEFLRPRAGKMRQKEKQQALLEFLKSNADAGDMASTRLAALALYELATGANGDFYAAFDGAEAAACFGRVLTLAHAPFRAALARFLSGARERFQREKRRRGVLDFADLLLEARARLREEPELARRWRFVLIDEFQDTDPLQKDILFSIAFPPNDAPKDPPVRLAIVGDQKQSIYGFRGADVQLMEEAGKTLEVRPLRQNYRSRGAVIEWINAFCARTLWPENGTGFKYDENHRMERVEDVARHAWDGPAGELLVLPEGEKRLNAAPERWRQALVIAQRIRTLVTPPKPGGDAALVRPRLWDKEQKVLRDGVRYGNIAILARQLKHLRLPLEMALTRMNIPFEMLGGGSFFTRQEVLDVTNLLAAVSDPSDQVARVGLMRSPFVQLSDGALFRLAASESWEGGAAAGLETAEAAALERGMALLRRLRDGLGRRTVAEIVDAACVETGYLSVLAMQPQGEVAVAAVRQLIELSRGFEARGARTLGDFVAWLREQADADWDDPGQPGAPDLAADLPEASDAVRVGTVHFAKGLEFPIVILADLGFERPPPAPAAVLTRGNQLGLRVGAESQGLKARADGWHDAAADAEREAELAELRRLLYVALTRARDYLILCGESRRKGAENWRCWVDQYEAADAGADKPRLHRVSCAHPELHAAAQATPRGLLECTSAGPKFRIPNAAPADAAKLAALRTLLEQVGAPPEMAQATWHEELSVTVMARFLSCPRRFALEQGVARDAAPPTGADLDPAGSAKKETGEGGDAAARMLGTAAHAALEAAFGGAGAGQAEAAWAGALATGGVDAEDAAARNAWRSIRGLLGGDWARAVLALPAERRFVERPFRWQVEAPHGSVTLRGVLDLLVAQPGSGGAAEAWQVVDYKLSAPPRSARGEQSRTTGSSPAHEALARYAWQVALYALAAAKASGFREQAVAPTLLFLSEEHGAAPLPLSALPLTPPAPERLEEAAVQRAVAAFVEARRSGSGDAAFRQESWSLDGGRAPRDAKRCAGEGCPFVARCFPAARGGG